MPSRRLALIAALACSLVPQAAGAQVLPGTEPWTNRGEPARDMVAGLHAYLDRLLAESVRHRPERWNRDFSSHSAYVASVEPNRKRFAKIIGAVDRRVSPVVMELAGTTDVPAKLVETDRYTVSAVRWPVYEELYAEGLLLEPKGKAKANFVVLGDASTTPEMLAGLAEGLPSSSQIARLLAANGCRVVVPTLLDRTDEFSGNPSVRMTNLTHREWIYRMAYEVGRHVIGYEVDEVRAAVDWLARPGQPKRPLGLVGHGEGGLVGLYAAAVDTRIDAAWIGGYFTPRETVWSEPIDRNVWGLLDEFGDAEVASLIASRPLIIEACRGPEVAGPPPPRAGRADAASGRLGPIDPTRVSEEYERALKLAYEPLKAAGSIVLVRPAAPQASPNADDGARKALLARLAIAPEPPTVDAPMAVAVPNPRARQRRLVRGMSDHTQQLARTSELRRYALWSKTDASTPAKWQASTESFRKTFHEEVIGQLPPASEPLKARSVRLYDQPRWEGYGIELPVWPGVVASGILLLPKDLRPGERRPVVVCQHGLEGRPEDVSDPAVKSVYHAFAAQLADRGYIVYAPQNPYIGHDVFRTLQRKANPLKKSLFSIIVRQQERTLEWLAALPQVDPDRIAFYGLSYGGKTAMRVPAILTRYCLSICSADFNEWVVKCTNLERQYSYMYTVEYDMYEFGLADGFNYAEMAGLIAPRPFQVERGHGDTVAPDEWVAYEFAKVKRLYDTLGLGERCELAIFNGGHQIDGKDTFAFLARHLNWPRGQSSP